ncbi:hypothetical protein RUM43_001555 [Polyplax serrata]|uniref:CUB domain-containing protein n=1 Tax=Polyplax serrata TaxID=468196 RepID=A0AAN8XQF2_POLSC
MSGLLKWLTFMCALSGVFSITSVRDDASWFKNGNRLKDKFVTGVVNGIFDTNCDELHNGTSLHGECMSKVECVKRKGKVGSPCSLLGVCCLIEKTCTEATSAKLSYFVTPTVFQKDCPLTVKIANKDVCQLRLDFEEFDIAQPTSMPEGDPVVYTSYRCLTDTFKVEQTPRSLGFSSLCGKNKGQHIYIPVGERQDTVVLRFNLQTRDANDNLQDPKWKVKIRQLECQKGLQNQHLNAPSKLMALYHSLKNKKHHHKSDYELIAPPNCLQYHPEKTGVVESFNYNNGKGSYIGPMDYAICFRKLDSCGVRYTSESPFQMNFNAYQAGMPPDDKCHPKAPASRDVSQDYLIIPGGVNAGNEFQDYYCNTDFNPQSNTAAAKSLKPLYLGVHTDQYRVMGAGNVDDFKEVGFRLRYEVESVNC